MSGLFRGGAGRTALCGILAAGSLVFLFLACAIPSGRIGVAALAGLFPVGAVLMAGTAGGYLCWAVSGILGLMLLPDKTVAILYLLFLGLYPVVKSQIEALQKIPLELFCKLLHFNFTLGLFWFFLRAIFRLTLPGWLEERTFLILLLGNAVFLLYDRGLSRLIGQMHRRLRRMKG